jgi:predicted ATPase
MALVQIGELLSPKTSQVVSKGTIKSLGQKICEDCSDTIEDFKQECVVENFGGEPLWYPWYPLCENCVDRREQEGGCDSAPTPSERREKEFLEMCPLAMRETDASRLDQDKVKAVLNHKLSSKGLLILGKTGMGKTRSMWLLIRELMVNRGIGDVRVFSSSELKDMLTQSHLQRHAHKDTIEGLVRCRVLCIDDLGKEKSSDSWEQDLFTIVDRRMLNKKPIIITSNFNGKLMIEKYNDVHKIEPMVRRLREFCDTVSFDRYPL